MTKETEVKKPTVKKVAPKAVPKSTIPKEDVVEDVVVEDTIPKRKKKIEIDRNEMVACRSTTGGKLIYVSTRSGNKYVWRDYGAVEYIDVGELLTMKSSQPTFLEDVLFVIDDEEAATFLGLDETYENVFQLGDINSFLKKDAKELEEILPKLPAGLKATVAAKAREAMENGTLDSRSIIKLIEDKLDVSLQVFDV